MKKIMLMAMFLVATAATFAGDSDALKAILKAKTYADAENLLKTNLAQLANNEEKAKAYNKLVELAMDIFDEQDRIRLTNQTLGKNDPVDEAAMAEAAYNAVANAMECDKYDQQPNAKGKINPKFAEKNAQRLWTAARFQLVNAGQEALSKQDYATARKYWTMFVDSDSAPLFSKCDRAQQAAFFGQVARIAAVLCYQDKDMDKALQLADIAMKDSAEFEQALNLKLEIYGNDLKNREDSVKYVDNLKAICVEHPTAGVIDKIYNTYMGLNMSDEASSFLDGILAKDPNNFVALADKGVWLLQGQKPEEAVPFLEKALTINAENPQATTYAALAYSMMAQNTEIADKRKELYAKAIKYFDKAKELDPDRLQVNWGYSRYNAYFNYYGENAPETKQAEQDYQ